MRSLLFVSAVVLCACEFPRPRELTVVFELGPQEVQIDATFSRLQLPEDSVHAVQSLALFSSAERAKRQLGVPWVTSVQSWALESTDAGIQLRVRAVASREAFEKCLAINADSGVDPCDLLPLSRPSQAEWYAELAHPEDDGYRPTAASTREWKADTKRFVLALERIPSPRDSYTRDARSLWPVFADSAKAKEALAWLDEVEAAVDVEDAAQLQKLAPLSRVLPALSTVEVDVRNRARDVLWYRLLRSLDSGWSGGRTLGAGVTWAPVPPGDLNPTRQVALGAAPAPAPAKALAKGAHSVFPVAPPPADWKWQARAAWEIWRNQPAAAEGFQRELCTAKWISKRADYQRFCATVTAF